MAQAVERKKPTPGREDEGRSISQPGRDPESLGERKNSDFNPTAPAADPIQNCSLATRKRPDPQRRWHAHPVGRCPPAQDRPGSSTIASRWPRGSVRVKI